MIILMCLSISSCDPGQYDIDREELNDVVSVELINYDNPEQKKFSSWVPDHFRKLKPIDLEKCEVLETLPEDMITDFVDYFSEREILNKYYTYNSPKDICIKLNYSDDSFLILWADYENESFRGYVGEYTSEGKVLSFWGSFCALSDYEYLVENYFDCKLKNDPDDL